MIANNYYSLIHSMGSGIVLDSDAQAFITAANITDNTQKSAIRTLVSDLKSYSLWSKMRAIYPFVGGTATSHKFNLKDPRDLDAAFRILWSGGITHSSTGVLFNGTTGYGDTNFNSLTNGSQDSAHISFYSRTTSNGTEIDIGNGFNSFNQGSLLEIRTSGVTYGKVNQTSVYNSFSDADSKGMYLVNRTASNATNIWKNSTKQVQNTTVSNTPANYTYYLGAVNNTNVAQFFTTKQCAFATIGDGLTDTDVTNLYSAVQSFQTSLSRQV